MHTGTDFLGSFEKLQWYERPILHGVAIGSILLAFFSAFPAGVLWLVRHRRPRPQPTKTDRLIRVARWSVVAPSVLNLSFLVGVFYGVFLADGAASGLPAYAFGPNPLFLGMMWLSFLVAVVPPGLVVVAALLRKKGVGSLLFRLYVSVYVIAAIGFVLLLNYWNLLGFRY